VRRSSPGALGMRDTSGKRVWRSDGLAARRSGTGQQVLRISIR